MLATGLFRHSFFPSLPARPARWLACFAGPCRVLAFRRQRAPPVFARAHQNPLCGPCAPHHRGGRRSKQRTWRPHEEDGSRTTRDRFLRLIRSNSYFQRNSNLVQNSEHQIRNRNENGFDIFPTVFYFSTFYSEYPEFEIRFKPNLAHQKSNLRKIVSFSYDLE